MLLSLAGLPLTAGFIGKFLVIAVGINSHRWLLVSALVINSAIGLFYYLRVMAMMYRPAPEAGSHLTARSAFPWPSGSVLLALTLALFWLGIYPAPVLRLIQAIMLK